MDDQEIVRYRIFPRLDELDRHAAPVAELLEELKTEALSVVYPVTESFIWQHEPFNLQVCSSVDDFLATRKTHSGFKSVEDARENDYSLSEMSSADTFIPHLTGKLRFGDNLEDEWFTVYLLLEISRRFPNVSITVRDGDAEFLLIESAFFIPNWLKPENSYNRVFLRNGYVHIVPPSRDTPRSKKSSETISLKKALQVLDSGVDTRASREVQNVILERLAGYPQKARKNLHRVRARVPLPVAQILAHEPQLISLAVESFYSRDMDAMKAASRMDKFCPRGEDGEVQLVDVVVRMSRAMYAQLVQQVFQAPRSYPMVRHNSPAVKEAEIGMKIAVGFEMMFWEHSSLDSLASEEGLAGQEHHQRKDIPVNDAAWRNYRLSLEKSGYFKGLLEGSKEHRELLQAAVVQYRSTDLFARVSSAMHAPVKRISELLSMPHSASDFANAGLEQSDSDHWLYDGEQDLATIIQQRQKEMDAYETKQEKRRQAKQNPTSAGEEELQRRKAAEVVKTVQSFVNKISSFEGAEIPDNDDGKWTDDDAVSLDMGKILKELESVFDATEISRMLSEAKEDTSSDSELDDSASGSEDDLEAMESEMAQGKKDIDLTDKGKDENSMFTDEYSKVLDEELKSSSLVKSFATAKEVSNTELKVSDSSMEVEPESAIAQKQGPESDDEDDLVDVDVNLVDSLLRSYMFQQGMPGPASNLLGAMGVELPDNTDQRPASSKIPNR